MGSCRTRKLKGQCCQMRSPMEKFRFVFPEISKDNETSFSGIYGKVDNLARYGRFPFNQSFPDFETNGKEISWE